MEIILATYRKYIDDCKYVFKSCEKYIVVLEKLDDTITNESRSNISDNMYSQYRANKLRVTLIFNKFDPFDIVEYIYNTNYHKSIKYEINKIVEEDDYNMDLNKIYTSGIHYFKTIEAAFYWQLLHFKSIYTGKYIEWYDNGNKYLEGDYLDGKKIGKWIYWFSNGKVKMKGEYLDGIFKILF